MLLSVCYLVKSSIFSFSLCLFFLSKFWYSKVAKHLRKLWSAAFRAMDDIKETVRNSGDKLCRALTSLTVRLSDVSLTGVSEARETMDIVLPFLLTEGILSKVDSIRKASIGIVMKLAKVSIVFMFL